LDSATTNYDAHLSPCPSSIDFVSKHSMGNQGLGQATQQWTFNGSPLAPKSNDGSPTPLPALLVGDNVLRIAVTAADGITKTTYAVVMHRLSDDATLPSLAVTPSSLLPAFTPLTADYALGLAASASTVALAPTPDQAAHRVDAGAWSATPNGTSLAVGRVFMREERADGHDGLQGLRRLDALHFGCVRHQAGHVAIVHARNRMRHLWQWWHDGRQQRWRWH
jgi:hypothetical protein